MTGGKREGERGRERERERERVRGKNRRESIDIMTEIHDYIHVR